MLVAYILIATCITILLGFPIAGALGLIAAVIMIATSGTDLLLIFIQRTYAATTSFPLLAIPFFILAGNLMNVGGTTERIFEVAKLLVGRVRGGLAYVNVIGSMIFAGMSGSAVADAAGLGVIEIRAMIKEGTRPNLRPPSLLYRPPLAPSFPQVFHL